MALTMDSGRVDTVPIILPKMGHYHFSVAFSLPTFIQGDLIGHIMYQFPTMRINILNQVTKYFLSVKHQQFRISHNTSWEGNTGIRLKPPLSHPALGNHLLLPPVPVSHSDLCCQNSHMWFLGSQGPGTSIFLSSPTANDDPIIS